MRQEIAAKPGEQPLEQPAVAHVRQTGIEALSRRQPAYEPVPILPGRQRRLERACVDVPCDDRERVVGHADVPLEGGLERAQPRCRLAARPLLVYESDAACGHLQILPGRLASQRDAVTTPSASSHARGRH